METTTTQTEIILLQIEEHIKLVRQQEQIIASEESSPYTKVQYKGLRRRTVKTIETLASNLLDSYIQTGD